MNQIIKSALPCFILCILLSTPTLASGQLNSTPTTSPHTFNGYISLTSNYVYRGVSLSNDDPSLQASFNYRHNSGLFATSWISQTKINGPTGPNTETNISLGYGQAFNLYWQGSCLATYYRFNGGVIGFDNHFHEWRCDISYDERYRFSMAQANNYYGLRFAGKLYEAEYIYPLTSSLVLNTTFGHWDISELAGSSYNYIQTGIQFSSHRFTYQASYHRASSVGRKFYSPNARPGWLAAISYHF